MENGKKYYAFISYKREDEKWAKWLQHKLEHYKLPSNLNGRTDLPREIRPVFRDQSELAGGILADEINKALTNSKYLIVICSPRAAHSVWVGKEVQTFIDLGRADKIIPFIIGGTAHAEIPEEECFPMALLDLPPERELLGINVDELGRDAAAVKVVAQMFGLEFDELWQRYNREQRKKCTISIVAIATMVLVALVVVGWIWKQRDDIRKEKWIKMENRAKYLATKADELTNIGQSTNAQRILLEVLPEDLENPDRPYTVEAEKAFRYALMNNSEEIGKAYDAVFSPSGQCILMVSWDTLFVYDFQKSDKLRFLSRVKGATVANYSPDGKRIVVGSSDVYSIGGSQEITGFIQILDAETGMCVCKMKTVGEVSSVAFNPDGKRVVSASVPNNSSSQGLIQVWDVESESELFKIKVNYVSDDSDKRDAAQFSPDGNRIITYIGNEIMIFDAQCGEKIMVLTVNDDVDYACYSPDGKRIFSYSREGLLSIWDADKGKKLSSEVCDKGYYYSASIDCDNGSDKIVLASNDIKIWNPKTGHFSKVIGSGYCDYGYSIARFSPDGRKLLSIEEDGYVGLNGAVKIWDVDIDDCALCGHSEMVNSICFNQDGKRIVSASNADDMVIVWDVVGGKELVRFSHPNVESVYYVADGKRIVSSSYSAICLWDADNGELLQKLDDCQGYGEGPISYDSINDRIMTCSDHEINVFDAQIDEINGVNSEYYNIVLSPDNRYLAGYLKLEGDGSIPASVFIIDAATGIEKHELIGHGGFVEYVEFSSDGKWLVSVSSYDGLIIVWDVESGGEIASFDGVHAVFSPDGRKLAWASSIDNVIHVVGFHPLQELLDQTRERFKD